MKLIELHILQSFPVSCLNRDDVGAPKTAFFGGANRARISSQSLKRAIRLKAAELNPEGFQGQRSRLIITPLVDRLEKRDVAEAKAVEAAKHVADALATLDEKAEKQGALKVKTLMFLSPSEMDAIADALANTLKADPKAKDIEKAASKAAKQAALKDAADIAIFGRMVASDHSLTVEGAGLFSHALSTHAVANDIDFFAAVDDLQSREEAGAGMTGTLEFNSATYYRYAALNLDLLFDNNHLAALKSDERRAVVDAFLRAVLLAVPGARKNSMNSNTEVGYALGIVKTHGQPLQLVNAFEEPVASKNGFLAKSVDKLKAHHERLKNTWNIKTAVEVAIPDTDLDTFCKKILAEALKDA